MAMESILLVAMHAGRKDRAGSLPFFAYCSTAGRQMQALFFFHRLLLSIILQNTIAAPVLTAVATIPAPTIAAGFGLPYWLR